MSRISCLVYGITSNVFLAKPYTLYLGPVFMKCPICGSLNFFVKDPEDEFETFEFELKDATIVYHSEADESDSPDVKDDTEVFCEKCSWHDKFQGLKNG